jgi:hypothetical protein
MRRDSRIGECLRVRRHQAEENEEMQNRLSHTLHVFASSEAQRKRRLVKIFNVSHLSLKIVLGD